MSIVTTDKQRLYLSSWEYNAAKIISEIANIVENKGGRVKLTNTAIISNRTLKSSIDEATERVDSLTTAITERGNTDMRTTALINYSKNLAELKAINNDPILVTHTSYITFIHDDVYYYYQVDDNPFFEFYYIKTPITGGKRSRDASMEEDKKEWLFDCFFDFNAGNQDITEAANLIYNMLLNAKNTLIMRDSKKQRVENRYNSGYHMEIITTPERIETIEF